jgi:type II secretory pathway predicted ATPase ExeA
MGEMILCPHLGAPGDKETRYLWPNILNVCYADQAGWAKFRPVELTHQGQFCLTRDHVLCPVYLRLVAAVRREGRPGRVQTHLEFFGLREEPFSIVPQPLLLCESQSQRQAHTGLRWLIDHRQGLGLLLGSVGTGKTLLCHALFEELNLNPQYVTALLLTPSQHSEYALMADLLACWKVKPQRRRSLRNLETAAHHFLAQIVLSRRKTAVLIVDEAQTLSTKQLQQVCKLLNWQDEGQQLLQVILAGQPSLQARLGRVPALRDRAVVEFALTPMTLGDMQQMISERLRRAGRRGDLFAPSALQLIYQHTGGMPRRVTILCLQCLWLAYQEGVRHISGEVVQAVVERASGGDLFATPGEAAVQMAASRSALTGWPSPSWLLGLIQRLWPRVAA